MKPKAIVITGYGINCDEETNYALTLAGADSRIVHINDLIASKDILSDTQILVFPGGFSYGDDTGSGKGLANKIKNNLFREIVKFIEDGNLVIGICNGFQVLANLGLLPAFDGAYGVREVALTHNDKARFECRWVKIKVNSTKCIYTKGLTEINIPVAHGEGNFYASNEILKKLEDNNQIVFRYINNDGSAANGSFPANPNGSLYDIAGICDSTGRVLGMMPHPERAIFSSQHPDYQELKEKPGDLPEIYEPAITIFKNAVGYFQKEIDIIQVIKDLIKPKTGLSYKDSGVDIELGDDASKVLYEAAKLTWENRKGKIGEVIAPFDDFSGVRVIDVSKLPEGSLMCLGFDGVGTKMEIAERLGRHDTIAFDLFAMVTDDAVVRGGEPAIVGSILDINCLEKDGESYLKFIKQLATGYVQAAKEAGVAVINGEMAELGARVSGFGDFNYNWGAGLVWFAQKERIFTGAEIKEGDSIVALAEKGFRSNGLSLARKILTVKYGENWHENRAIAEAILEPSKIYSRVICEMNGGFSNQPKAGIHGVIHVTGGGVPGKLSRVLKPSGLGANLSDLFDPCEMMLKLQELGKVSDEEAYRTWNMGQGMLVITNEPEKVIKVAESFKIEAKIAGEIRKEPGIVIVSKGYNKKGDKIVFGS